LLGQIDKYAIKELLSKADIALVSFMQVPILRTNSPNKAFDALAAGLPIIFTNKSWLADQAGKNHFGVYLDLKNPNMAFQKLDNWLNDEDTFHKSRWHAKKAAEELYDKDALCRKVLSTVDPNYLGSKISELKASGV
jgi:glycosyltransferase involved in cell wall biosynthesis